MMGGGIGGTSGMMKPESRTTGANYGVICIMEIMRRRGMSAGNSGMSIGM
jgi:hypothetical protein